MMSDITALIERLEQASGPDRELDVAIFREIGAPVPFQFANKLFALTYDEAEQCYFAPAGDMRVRYEPPAYTASIDAALTLVPEGMEWHVGHEDGAPFAHVHRPGEYDSGLIDAATPVIAICIASLRARETPHD
jgi:hypothetical protein